MTIREARQSGIAPAARVAAEAFRGEAFNDWLFDLSRPRGLKAVSAFYTTY